MSGKKKIRAFVIPTGSIKAFGTFKKLIESMNLSDNDKEDIIEEYEESNS